jgi:uncharacterized protein with von Willebrand factor type A (vWA) domain
MFLDFFYKLKDLGVPVSPTSFLTLQKALETGLVMSLDDFYTASRSILIKNERYFDLFDQVFAHYFKGADLPDPTEKEISETVKFLLEQWLKDPKVLSDALGIDEDKLTQLSPDELVEYFKQRLEEQKGRHDGGNRWIGTGGTSPVGHSGYHPGGMRVEGISRNKSAVKVALERRYRDYSKRGLLNQAMVGEALKRLRNLVPVGPKDKVNVEKSIYQTMKNAGEIEIVFDARLRDRLRVILAIDNGGWSMEPYVQTVQTLFDYAQAQFKELKIFYFHNTIYDNLWRDPARRRDPVKIEDFGRFDPQSRLIIVGDASMATFELLARDGTIYVQDRSTLASIERLQFLADTFYHCAWLNPVPAKIWSRTATIGMIAKIFPMFQLTLDGLEEAVSHLAANRN